MTTDPSVPPTPDSPPAAEPTKPAAPAKKPGLIRRSFVILVLILVVGIGLSIPFVIDPWVATKVRDGVEAMGLELSPDTSVEVSILKGHIRLAGVKISETYKGETHEVLTADEITIDLALAECLGGDVVIEALIAKGLSGDLRRRGDGSVPLITPPEDEQEPGTDWSKVDWWGYGKRFLEWAKKQDLERKQAKKEAEENPAQKPPRPPAKVQQVPGWESAKQYVPSLLPGQRGPRVLIHRLEISGRKVGMPDESAFDITEFSLVGSDITGIQLAEETMNLTGEIATRGAGPMRIVISRKPGDLGAFTLTADALPLQVVADPKVSGDALAKYDPKGIAKISLTSDWDDWAMKGRLDSTIEGLVITAPPGDKTAMQVEQVVTRMKGKPIRWPIGLGGKLYAPTITDSGIDDLIKGSLAGAAKDIVTEEATKRANDLLDKQGEKNPEVKQAADKLKGLLGGEK